jgi:hypothetical protein
VVTQRSETTVPITVATRLHLIGHRDELRDLARTVDVARGDLRDDAESTGLPIPADAVRMVQEAGDLLILASNLIDPDKEGTR